MTREELIKVFNNAEELKDDVEYIVNKNKSLKNKLEYYCKAYDENCVHAMNDKIKIVNAGCIDFYIGEEN